MNSLYKHSITLYDRSMNDIQELLAQLREKKWTDAAISDELGVHLVTVQTWRSGKFYPSNAKPVALALRELLRRKRIPKQKRGSRYSGRMRTVEAPPENDGQT